MARCGLLAHSSVAFTPKQGPSSSLELGSEPFSAASIVDSFEFLFQNGHPPTAQKRGTMKLQVTLSCVHPWLVRAFSLGSRSDSIPAFMGGEQIPNF